MWVQFTVNHKIFGWCKSIIRSSGYKFPSTSLIIKLNYSIFDCKFHETRSSMLLSLMRLSWMNMGCMSGCMSELKHAWMLGSMGSFLQVIESELIKQGRDLIQCILYKILFRWAQEGNFAKHNISRQL
jgi:hypothetical protein